MTRILNIIGWLAIWLIGLGAQLASAQHLNVVASFSILGDMVQEVAGEHATVTTIVGADRDAHVYQPSVADAAAVADADLIFINGLGFETWAATLIAEAGSKARVIVATKGIEPIEVDGQIDPHAWNALTNGMTYVRNIAEALSDAQPAQREAFEANAAAYIAALKALDAETRSRLARLPQDRRTVVTAHDAFGYLANAYGLRFLAPLGIDTEAEPSAREIAALISQLRRETGAALFVENITSPALLRQIADETGLKIGGRLYSDALSERGGPAKSYLAMFEHNLGAILDALED